LVKVPTLVEYIAEGSACIRVKQLPLIYQARARFYTFECGRTSAKRGNTSKFVIQY